MFRFAKSLDRMEFGASRLTLHVAPRRAPRHTANAARELHIRSVPFTEPDCLIVCRWSCKPRKVAWASFSRILEKIHLKSRLAASVSRLNRPVPLRSPAGLTSPMLFGQPIRWSGDSRRTHRESIQLGNLSELALLAVCEGRRIPNTKDAFWRTLLGTMLVALACCNSNRSHEIER